MVVVVVVVAWSRVLRVRTENTDTMQDSMIQRSPSLKTYKIIDNETAVHHTTERDVVKGNVWCV